MAAARIPKDALVVATLLILAAGALLWTGDRWGRGARDAAMTQFTDEQMLQMRADAAQCSQILARVVRDSRRGQLVNAELGVDRFAVSLAIPPAPAAADPEFVAAERVEFTDQNPRDAFSLYLRIARESPAAPARLSAARAARRLASTSEEKKECVLLLQSALAAQPSEDRASLLARLELSLDDERARAELLTDLDKGRFAAVPPAERLITYKKLGGDPKNGRMLASAAAVLDANDPEAVAEIDGGFLTWRIVIFNDRIELAMAAARAFAAAASQGVAAGDFNITSSADPAPGADLPLPFVNKKLILGPRVVAAAITHAEAEYRLRVAVAGFVAMLLGVGAGFFVVYARRRDRLESQTNNFLAATTHELKTPLANIRLYAETIQTIGSGKIGGEESLQIAKFTQTILDESDRLTERIQEILDVAAGRRGAAGENVTFEPAPALSAVVKRYESAAQAEGGILVLQINGVLPTLRGGAGLFQRSLAAVIENAIKFGRGTKVEIVASKEGSKVKIYIDDGGPGIPAGDRERVFEAFVRLEDELTRRTAGTGLGLTLARQCAAACNGNITIQSNPRGGARVCFEFATTV